MNVLNERQKMIIKIIVDSNNEYIPVNKIATLLNISEKTVYRELERIEELNEFKIEKVKGKGIKITEINKNLKSFYEIGNIIIEKFSVKQRRYDIYYNLLIDSPRNTTLNLLSEKYFVGQASIVNDIKYIQENLLFKELILKKDKNGTRIEGTENNIRKAISYLIEKYKIENEVKTETSSRIDSITYNELVLKFGEINLQKVEMIIKQAEEKLFYRLGDVYYVNLCIHILIMLKRCESFERKYDVPKIEIKDKYLYSIAINIVEFLKREFCINIQENEVYNIYQYLCSSGIAKLDKNFNKKIKFDGEEYFIEFLEKIKEKLNIDIEEMENLYLMFRIHIKALLNRIRFNIEISNSLLEEIKGNFGCLYMEIKKILKTLSKENILNKISDDEIGYIVMYYQVVLENKKEERKVLIVCSSGIGISQLLKNRIENKIKSIIVVDTLPNIEIEKKELNGIDLIISTVKLNEEKINKPVVYVTALLTDEDIKKINQRLYE